MSPWIIRPRPFWSGPTKMVDSLQVGAPPSPPISTTPWRWRRWLPSPRQVSFYGRHARAASPLCLCLCLGHAYAAAQPLPTLMDAARAEIAGGGRIACSWRLYLSGTLMASELGLLARAASLLCLCCCLGRAYAAAQPHPTRTHATHAHQTHTTLFSHIKTHTHPPSLSKPQFFFLGWRWLAMDGGTTHTRAHCSRSSFLQ